MRWPANVVALSKADVSPALDVRLTGARELDIDRDRSRRAGRGIEQDGHCVAYALAVAESRDVRLAVVIEVGHSRTLHAPASVP